MHEKIRHSSKNQPSQCPGCGSEKVARILRGYPTPEAFAEEKRGAIVLGGCVITGDDPSWQCLDCQVVIYADE